MNIGIPGKFTGKSRDDGSPITEYTREELALRARSIESQINALTAESVRISSLLANDYSKTFYL